MKMLYTVLLDNAQESFKKRMIPIQDVTKVGEIYHDQPELCHAALSRMASMDEVWATFNKHTSWYNFDVVEGAVKLRGDERDKKNLEEFRSEWIKFAHHVNGDSDQRRRITAVLKLEEDFMQFTNERLEQVCLILCDLLETTVRPLDVQEGCVEVTISIPAEVAEETFPLSSAMIRAFQKAFPTLISISCGRIVETFETAEDTDDSNGQEQCSDKGFNEDDYFADASESDEEECGKRVKTYEKTCKNRTSHLKIWLISAFLSLLLMGITLPVALMWNTSLDPLRDTGPFLVFKREPTLGMMGSPATYQLLWTEVLANELNTSWLHHSRNQSSSIKYCSTEEIILTYKISKSVIHYILHPDIEGSYCCGNISTELVSSNNWTLVAYPIQDHYISDFRTGEVAMQGFSGTAELHVLSMAQNVQVELTCSPDNLNNITLICRNNSMTLDTADFWVNSTDQPLTSMLSNYNIETSMIQFLLHPNIEGSYCISAEFESSKYLTPVAYPIQDRNLSDFYTGEVGSSITLSCPFPRGALTQLYSFSWIKGVNTVVGGMQRTPRFSGNSTDSSLTIQNLTLSDNSEYWCRVFIANPIENNWAVDSDPIQLSVYASPIALSPTPVSNSASIAMNITSRVKPHSHRPLKYYEAVCIAIGVCLFIFLCLVCGIGILLMVSYRRQRRKIVDRWSVITMDLPYDRASCGYRASCLSSQDEGNSSLQVQIRESQNMERLIVFCDGPECDASLEVQPATMIELSQSQEHTVTPTEVTRDSLPIGQSIGDTNHCTMHTANGRSQLERHSRLCSGLTVRSSVSDTPTTSSAQSRGCPNRNSEVPILQSIEDYQVESNELMFLGPVRVLMCDSRGGRFQIPEHDITLSFPQGAVPDTIQVEVEVGVAIHGLFDFPDDIRPISALVWVHVRSPNFRFQKPIEISLPHYLKLNKNDVRNNSHLGLHSMVTDREEDDHLIFKEGAKEQVSYKQVQPEPITPLQWQIHFCSYNLCSFTEMIKQQYRSQGNVINPEPFQFILPPTGKQPELEIHFQSPTKGWQLTLPMCKKQIPQSAVELWEDDVSVLQDRVRHKRFPPRVTVEVAGGSTFADTTQLFSFEGARTTLEREVHLCLPGDRVAQHKNTLRYLKSRYLSISWLDPSLPSRAIQSRYSYPDNMVSLPHHQAHPDEPTDWELFEVMKVIAGVGHNWRTLIPLLSIPPDKEEEILHDSPGLKEQILKVLRTWRMVHQSDGTSTRAHLAAILRAADPLHLHRAVKLLKKFNADILSQ